MQSLTGRNRRVLVIDDNKGIHADARKIMAPAKHDFSSLEAYEAGFFGGPIEPVVQGIDVDFEVSCAASGDEGVALVKKATEEKRSYAMAFVDMRMPPGIDGVETTRQIWAIDPRIQIVLCTAYSDYTLADIIRELGTTDQLLILRKPFDPIEMALLAISQTEKWNTTRHSEHLIRMKTRAIEDSERVMHLLKNNRNRLRGRNQQLKDETSRLNQTLEDQTLALLETREVTCLALAQLAEARDTETGEHIRRHQVFTQIVARHLSLEGPYADLINDQFLEDLWRCSPLHDVGKVGISDDILLKPGRLTAEEFAIMKTHTTLGAEVLRVICQESSYGSFLSMAVDIALHHHEHFDGNGYPEGLSGTRIPLAARIVAVTDVFDALVSKRVYKNSIPASEARHIIVGKIGTQFDPVVVQAFCDCFQAILNASNQIEARKDSTSSSGFKLTPSEFEQLLNTHPDHNLSENCS